jgi:hypothetical protein
MKLIKFNLPLNGASINTLEQLQNNLTAEILDHFRSGKLRKWAQTRNLIEQADKLKNLVDEDIERETDLLKSICDIFDSQPDGITLQAAIEERRKLSPTSQYLIDEEIEKIREDFSKKETEYLLEIQKLKQDAAAIKDELEEKDLASEWKSTAKFAFHTQILMKLSSVCLKSSIALFHCRNENKKVIPIKEVESWFEGLDMEKLCEESGVVNEI